MKKVYYLMATLLIFQGNISFSQNEVKVNILKGKQYAVSLSDSIRYYYYPNLQAYFDLHDMVYIYKIDGKWKRDKYLSPNYRGYCIYNKRHEMLKGLIDDDPTCLLEQHKKKFPQYFSSREMKLLKMKQEREALTLN